jgi:hypothetical protein
MLDDRTWLSPSHTIACAKVFKGDARILSWQSYLGSSFGTEDVSCRVRLLVRCSELRATEASVCRERPSVRPDDRGLVVFAYLWCYHPAFFS